MAQCRTDKFSSHKWQCAETEPTSARTIDEGFAMLLPRTIFVIVALYASARAVDAAPDAPIGSAITVVNYVTAKLETDAGQRRLASGDDVRRQELIEVDENSRSDIELNDRTKLALGPGSRLLLDKFVYDPDLSGGAIVLNLIKGTFRFITGIAAKPAYVIQTPAASITVRGTIFDIFILSPDETWLLLIEGGVEVCASYGGCLVHDQPGKLIRITADDVRRPVKWASMPRKPEVSFDDAFPFVVSPPAIDPDPIFTREDIVLGDEDEREDQERPKEAKSRRIQSDDDHAPPPTLRKRYREHRTYSREVTYRPTPRHEPGRGRRILKKAAKVGVGVAAGAGLAYGLAKALRRRGKY